MTEMTLGKYHIIAEIGKGGFATVYRALDTTLDREVALKVLDPILARDPTWVSRFQREAKAIARLKHPHIVTIHEIGESEGRLYIAMELIDGPSLAQRIATQGRLPWDEAVALLGQVAAALDTAHGQGVLHRDLKPGNILLDPARGAILTDFGFARLVGESSMSVSLSGGVVGTPAYIAPEVWDGEEPTAQTDLYSLGCVAYEMLTGEVLFAGKTPSVVMRKHLMDGPQLPEKWPEGMPAGIRDILARAVMKDPAARYASAREFTTALAASRLPVRVTSALAPVTTRETPVDKTEQDTTHIRPPVAAARRRWPILAGATVGMVALLAIIWALTRSPASPPVARSTATALPTAPGPAAAQAEPTTAAQQQPTSPAPVTPTAAATSAPTATPTETTTMMPTAAPTATSTGTATPTPGPAFTVREGSSVNVRSGPGTVYPVIGALQAGETRIVTGRTATGDWWKFDYNGKSGWVSGQVVTANQIAATVAVAVIPPTPTLPTAVPAFKPTEASAIVFASARGGNPLDLYIMNVDGTNVRRLTDAPGYNEVPRVSHDGTKIAFQSTRTGEYQVFVMNLDGSNLQQLTNCPSTASCSHPSWSLDDSKLLYTCGYDTCIMKADGSDEKRLLGSFHFPRLSPDGIRVAGVSLANEWDIFVVNLDGSNRIRLAANAGWDYWPDWSPDGKTMVFASSLTAGGLTAIFLMNSDGSNKVQLTEFTGDVAPVFSPDGFKIAFKSGRDGNNEIYVMSNDGSNQIRLTNSPWRDEDPAWVPVRRP